jgi:N6-L-threonylcarbamoyladenine synthase
VLIVSGGHTELVLVDERWSRSVLGRTRDDAAGEAFDKVARMLGLGYPGGPEIDRIARDAPPARDSQRLPKIQVPGLDFSFSGIKTAVRYRLEKRRRAPGAGDGGASPELSPDEVRAVAADFQDRAVSHLVEGLEKAVAGHRPASVAVVGGVARNHALRQAVAALGERHRVPVIVPPAILCTDNAAMIATAGDALWRRGLGGSLDVDPSLGWDTPA